MDIGKSFTYVFEDPKWIMKVLIGGIVFLIPIVNFAAIGFMLTTMKNAAEGQQFPMPEWADFGALFMKGLYAFVGMLIYFLPAILFLCCAGVVTGVGAGAIGGAASGSNGNAGTMAQVVGYVGICLNCIGYLLELVAAVAMFAPLTRFAMSNNQLNIFWDFRTNIDLIMKNLTNYIIALLIGLVASFVASFGIILCIIGVAFTTFWAYMVSAYMWAQFWRVAQGTGTAPATM
jgi:hypothetical protein